MATPSLPEFQDPVNKRWADAVQRLFLEMQREITALRNEVENLRKRS